MAMQSSGSVTLQWRTSDAINSNPTTYVTGQTLPQWVEFIYDGNAVWAYTSQSRPMGPLGADRRSHDHHAEQR